MNQKLKVFLIILPFIIGFNIIGFTFISPKAFCGFENTNTFNYSSSRIILSNLNKTIFFGSLVMGFGQYIAICDDKHSETYYSYFNHYNLNCSIEILQQAVSYKDLIKNTEIKLNGNELEVTEKGFFCFGKKI